MLVSYRKINTLITKHKEVNKTGWLLFHIYIYIYLHPGAFFFSSKKKCNYHQRLSVERFFGGSDKRKHSQDPLRGLEIVGSRTRVENLKAVCLERKDCKRWSRLNLCMSPWDLTNWPRGIRLNKHVEKVQGSCLFPVMARVACRSCAFWVTTRVSVSVSWELEKGNETRPCLHSFPDLLSWIIWNCHFYMSKMVQKN